MVQRTLLCGVIGLIAGTATAFTVATGARGDPADAFIAAAHVPPLLTIPVEDVVLRYAIVCPPPDGDLASGPCDGGGAVFARAGHAGAFRQLPLIRGDDSADGRYFVALPTDIATSPTGFSYYAVLRDNAHGTTTTLPQGGAAAPQNSYRIASRVDVSLGEHRFGATRRADARVVDAKWGRGAGDVGLGGGVGEAPLGPSSFDVAPDGTVTLLDEMNGRVERFRHGVPDVVSVDVPPALDDMSVADDGSIYVADGRSDKGETPLLRTFDGGGHLRRAEHLAERTWSQLRVGPSGPVVQEHPSEQWMPSGPARKGFAGRPIADGSRLIVLRVAANELRVARVAGGAVRDAWRFLSDTPLGEVQLVDRVAGRLIVVVKMYTETLDEFDVITVGAGGSVREFGAPASEWAETAPLSRFRIDGRRLYQLGSTPRGAFIDRYDIGGGG